MTIRALQSRSRPLTILLLAGGLLVSPGCVSWFHEEDVAIVDESPAEWELSRVVGDLTVPVGLQVAKIQGVSMVTGLDNTGSDPPPSPLQEALLNEMRIRKIAKPNTELASPRTSLVVAEAYIEPGARVGQRVDIRVLTSRDSETTSLVDGWMLETSLSESAVLEGRLRKGETFVRGHGAILTDNIREGRDDSEILLKRGVILGGGILKKDRPIGLAMRADNVSVQASARVGQSINSRFFSYQNGGGKTGVANPLDDKKIELRVHPKYFENVPRFLRVVRYIPIGDTTEERLQRIQNAEAELMIPESSEAGAMKLEALGKDSLDSLKKGLASKSPLVRFCAAEALAYLDDPAAIPTLTEAARSQSEFRHRAYIAFGTLDDLTVIDELEGLLHCESAEARYGAFDTLLEKTGKAPIIRGVDMKGKFIFHPIRSKASPLVHFRLSERPEVVVFGDNIPVRTDAILLMPKGLTITGTTDGKVKVTRVVAGRENRSFVCEPTVTELIKGIVDADGDYPEVMKVIYSLKQQGAIDARVEADSLAHNDRVYFLEREEDSDSDYADDEMLEEEAVTEDAEAAESEEIAASEKSGDKSWWRFW
ncbi:HEAT repeat domain-containing protein [Blastopirellula sp. J2-11]|uniref:HEAT repeat domain-containing protein n=1 Tax=Blastopirellula sp. J2-11 TaxID=2943192 RepID=UPI0021C8677F|nr:HEAT repeat domain-containing protein [Blastopirellula sp. J2-11]UUO04799.1 HEAT repeat domain-containing protein [Blastopirellula sp. J2-11]